MAISEILEADSSVIFGSDDSPVTAETSDYKYPDALPGTCKVCGKPAASKAGKYCEDHKKTHDKRGRKPGSTTKPQESKSDKNLKADLQATFTMIGFAWSMQGPNIAPEVLDRMFPEVPETVRAQIQHPGNTLAAQSEAIADAFTHLADSNPRIRRWLELASQPSGYIAVGMAVMPVVTSAQLWYGVVVPRVKELESENAGA
ncbi:MAG: hypothetical protein JSR64_17085 [Nitrospira sp.]|nr:hypothetical protein [Nitrospira sp.]